MPRYAPLIGFLALAGCGGVVAPSADGGADAASLAACAHACVVATQNDCPVLLLYECLKPCGDSASTAICEQGNGSPAPLATIECAQATFPACPATSCQGSQDCQAFVSCIEGCH